MLRKLMFITILAALTLSACAAQRALLPEVASYAPAATSAPVSAEEPALDNDAVRQSTGAGNAPQAGFGTASGERLVIKNANLSLVVKDPATSVEAVTALAESLEGFVVSSNTYLASTDAAGNKIMQATITIRVPAEKFLETIAQLEAMDVDGKADNKTVSGEDVTAQYTDLESQLRNLEAAETQLQKIMDGATKTEDVLSVYNQLVYVRGQIEQVKGQMKYYTESAAMSLVTINLIPDALSQPIAVGGWKPEGVAKEALEALVRAFQGIATALIWGAVYLLPLGLVFGIPGYLGVRFLARRMRKVKKETPATA